MTLQRISCLKCGNSNDENICDDCQHKVPCKEWLDFLPPTVFYTYSNTSEDQNVRIVSMLKLSIGGKLVEGTNLNKHLDICV